MPQVGQEAIRHEEAVYGIHDPTAVGLRLADFVKESMQLTGSRGSRPLAYHQPIG
jgi:hypothetical protein